MARVRTNAAAFNADLDKFAKQVELDVGKVRRKVAIDVLSLAQAPEKPTGDGVMVPGVKHPVDTGRARFGWAMSDGSPSSFRPPPGTYAAAPGHANDSATFADPFQVTYVVNNVGYIGRLEFDSHSPQAPGGWVRKAISLLTFDMNSRTREPR